MLGEEGKNRTHDMGCNNKPLPNKYYFSSIKKIVSIGTLISSMIHSYNLIYVGFHSTRKEIKIHSYMLSKINLYNINLHINNLRRLLYSTDISKIVFERSVLI